MPANARQTRSGPMGIPSGGVVNLGSILGIAVRIDWSWIVIFALITFSVSQEFKLDYPNPAQYWAAGLVTSLLFFVSIFLHEMGHSLVARHYGIEVASITLFIFGGVASIRSEPKRPGEEFWIAIAGPAVSVSLAAIFYGLSLALQSGPPALDIAAAVAQWLGLINLILAIFNLIPGFPLDGGRVLRSIVWTYTDDFDRSTRIAAGAGQVVAYLFMGFGIYQLLAVNHLIGGLWMLFIGWFLLRAAQGSVAQLSLRHAVAGVRAVDILDTSTPYVSPGMSLSHLANEYVFRLGRSRFLVYDGSMLRGLVTLTDVKNVPHEDWDQTSVQAVMVPTERLQTIQPGEPLEKVMQLLDEHGVNQLPVVQDGVFYGLVTREMILRVLRSRIEFGRR